MGISCVADSEHKAPAADSVCEDERGARQIDHRELGYEIDMDVDHRWVPAYFIRLHRMSLARNRRRAARRCSRNAMWLELSSAGDRARVVGFSSPEAGGDASGTLRLPERRL